MCMQAGGIKRKEFVSARYSGTAGPGYLPKDTLDDIFKNVFSIVRSTRGKIMQEGGSG